jgi:hypothetical protein
VCVYASFFRLKSIQPLSKGRVSQSQLAVFARPPCIKKCLALYLSRGPGDCGALTKGSIRNAYQSKDKLSKDIEPHFTREDQIVGVLASLPPFKMVSNKMPSVAGQGRDSCVT